MNLTWFVKKISVKLSISSFFPWLGLLEHPYDSLDFYRSRDRDYSFVPESAGTYNSCLKVSLSNASSISF